MYRPELVDALATIERRNLLIALEALTDMESWARMRDMYGLSFDEGCAVWIRAIDRILPPTRSETHRAGSMSIGHPVSAARSTAAACAASGPGS